MEPLNLSGMEHTPAENRAALDNKYQEKIWHLAEKYPVTKKSKTLKALERKSWQASCFKKSDCFHGLHVIYHA